MLGKEELKGLLRDSTIMLVDDDEDIRDGMKAVLGSFFGHVIVAKNGRRALELYRENPLGIDIIITDINMPVVNGLTFCQEIIKINENQPIIVISAHNESQYLVPLIEIGIDAFIVKPFKQVELLARIKKAIEHNYYRKKIQEQQAKLASVGAMMENITHQWKQPLNIIQIKVGQIEIEKIMKTLTNETLQKCVDDIKNSMGFISQTINDFRGFFDPNAIKTRFNIYEAIHLLFRMLKSSFSKDSIQLIEEFDTQIVLEGYENALQQIIMNLMTNAKDALIQTNDVMNRYILIQTQQDNKYVYIKVIDNGGGISDSIKDFIFDSHFSTKGAKGSGIGLSMSKQLAKDKLNADLYVENINTQYGIGACFTLKITK